MKLAIFALGLSLSSGLVACTTTPPHSEASSAAQPASTDQEDLVDAYVQEWMEAHDFNGIVLVQKNADKHVIVDGVADHESGRPLTEDTVFQSGSIDKFFASIAVFALAEEGRLDIDAPISTYLPDYRRDTGDRLTLKHLMANRSGRPWH